MIPPNSTFLTTQCLVASDSLKCVCYYYSVNKCSLRCENKTLFKSSKFSVNRKQTCYPANWFWRLTSLFAADAFWAETVIESRTGGQQLAEFA